MFAGNLGEVARAALSEGAPGLAQVVDRAASAGAADARAAGRGHRRCAARLGTAALEWKVDGARVQVHKAGDEVRVYTRTLNDVTASVPEIVEAVRGLPARELVLDGEAIALAPGGAPQPFQMTMRRFGRKLDVERLRAELPLAAFFFDCLRRDGDLLVDRPAHERFAALDEALPAALVVPRLVTSRCRGRAGLLRASAGARPRRRDGEGARRAVRGGPPRRELAQGQARAHARSGRARGRMGARPPAGAGCRTCTWARAIRDGGFVMLGKTFKGMTDEMLEWQTRELLAREMTRDDYTVYVRPELVVEIAFNDLQASPQYPGGLALRFARVKGYRADKRADEADTIETVRALYEQQIAQATA